MLIIKFNFGSMIFIKLLSFLPFTILYWLSDLLSFFLSKIIRYRRNVIIHNLKNSFPGKSHKEIKSIAEDFYRNLADVVVEAIKIRTLSPAALQKRVKLNADLPNKYFYEKKSIIVLTGHLSNWEWLLQACCSVTKANNCALLAVYRPLHNKAFDELMLELRTRFGAIAVAERKVLRELTARRNEIKGLAMVADQTPGGDIRYWTNFLHQETGFFTGAEKLARLSEIPVLFASMKRVKRGYYEVNFELIEEPPFDNENENSIIEKYSKKLEAAIIQSPSQWLWSHRRWKHKRKSDYLI